MFFLSIGDDDTPGNMFNNGHVFSTIHNDATGIHTCPFTHDSGWWFAPTSTCTNVNLFGGRGADVNDVRSMYWKAFHGVNGLYFTSIKIATKMSKYYQE